MVDTHIEHIIRSHNLGNVDQIDVVALSGGCINKAYKVTMGKDKYFLKLRAKQDCPGMFEKESIGLLHLARYVQVPSVLAVGTRDSVQYLVLEFVQDQPRDRMFWLNFGQSMARLHKVKHTCYGYEIDNYIGPLPQVNVFFDSWIAFFVHNRLLLQIERAERNHLMSNSVLKKLEQLIIRLPQIIPEGSPSLLHGDLWNGNFISMHYHQAALIDPAIYFGNREIEIAFTKLFGGFDPNFYYAYHEAYPLEHGFEHRVDIYNLYPLLVHLNIFGKSYLPQIESILQKYK